MGSIPTLGTAAPRFSVSRHACVPYLGGWRFHKCGSILYAVMVIYGTALLALSLLVGLSLGRWLGALFGLDADIGGVGLAMLLLIIGTDWLHCTGRMKPPTDDGIRFWAAMYIPVVVAMAATQNVRAAISGGVMATVAGVAGVVVCFAPVGLFTRLGRRNDQPPGGPP